MALTVDTQSASPIEPEELLEWAEDHVDPADPNGLVAAADKLAGLGANRRFLRDAIEQELKIAAAVGRIEDGPLPRRASTQSLLFGRRGAFTIRANIWSRPAVNSERTRAYVDQLFSYTTAHDHNFALLTVGYAGPGYTTTIYEHQRHGGGGMPGEHVDLRFLETTQLTRGKVMFYRPLLDVHIQHYPSEASISLNLLAEHPSMLRNAQFEFDTENSSIKGLLPGTQVISQIGIFRILSALGNVDGNVEDVLVQIAVKHYSPFVRGESLKLLARITPRGRYELIEKAAEIDPSPFVRTLARELTIPAASSDC